MSGEVISKKRAARIERRKAKIAAIFNIDGKEETMTEPTTEDVSEEPASKKPRLSDEEYQVLRKKLKDRKRALIHLPQFRLVQNGLRASLNVSKESRVPVLANDVQCLLLFSIVGDSASFFPYRWCNLIKWKNLTQTVVVAIDNVSVADFEDNPDLFPETRKIFEDAVEMTNPRSDGFNLGFALAYTPLSLATKRRIRLVYQTMKNAANDGYVYGLEDLLQQNGLGKKSSGEDTSGQLEEKGEKSSDEDDSGQLEEEPQTLVSDVSQSSDTKKTKVKKPERAKGYGEIEDKSLFEPCSRLQLMLSPLQLVTEHYPVPGNVSYKKYLFTKEEYAPVTDTSPMFSLDCEWCQCIDGSTGLARVAIVDEHFKTVYHTYVKPKLPISDYMTKWSGITRELLVGVKTTLEDVQNEVRRLLPPDAIIVGQSVNSDLKAMHLIHPYIIDTSVIYNLTGGRAWKSKLSLLTDLFCRRNIQCGSRGHSPIEDAIAAMELVQLKLAKGLAFGDVILSRGSTDWDVPAKERLTNYLENGSPESSTPAKKGQKKEVKEEEEECMFDINSPLHIKLFTLLQSHNRDATLIVTQPALAKMYQPKLISIKPGLVKRKEDERLVPPVRVVTVEGLKEVVRAVEDTRLDSSFTLVHTSVEIDSEEEDEDEASKKKKKKMKKKTLMELDKAIGDIYRGISLQGMMVLIFGGSKDALENGACFVRINRPNIV